MRSLFFLLLWCCCSSAASAQNVQEILNTFERRLRRVEEGICETSEAKEIGTFFVGGGIPSSKSVEVFQIRNPAFRKYVGPICRKRTNLPLSPYVGLAHPVAASFKDHVLVCGGSKHYRTTDKCFLYNSSSDTWSESQVKMNDCRYQAVSLRLPNGRWWVAGGADKEGRTLSSTEIYDPGSGTFTPSLELPIPAKEHCLLSVNRTHMFFTTGDDGAGTFAWLYSEADGWKRLPDMTRRRNKRPICGYVESRGFTEGVPRHEIVVAGSSAESFAHRASEIFDLDRLSWRQGPPLPESFVSGLAIPWSKSFLILGESDEVYEYVEELWLKRAERLRRREHNFGPFVVEVDKEFC